MAFKFLMRFAACSLALAPVSALADPITLSPADVGTSFDVSYNGYDGSGVIGGLTATATFTLASVTGTSYLFNYSVANTSSSPITTSRISGFGFDTNPTISNASSTGTFDTTATSANVPNVGTVDVCFKGGGGTNSCAGGGGGGVDLGGTGTGSFTLDFASALASLDLSDFFVRYQSITGTDANTPSSAVGSGTIGSSSGGPAPVPEPGMMLLFALGLGGLLIAYNRQSGMARSFRSN
jgi:hypothetical protein